MKYECKCLPSVVKNWHSNREESSFHLNWMSIYVCQEGNIMTHSTWHLSELGNGCSLFFNSPAPSRMALFPFSHWRETENHRLFLYLHLPHSPSLWLYSCTFSLPLCTYLSLSFPPLLSHFLAFALSRTLLPSVSFCFLLPLPLSLSLRPRSVSPSSSQLSCSGIVPRSSDIKISSPHCCPVFPSSRPCNIKVRGDRPAVFNERSFTAEGKAENESRRGKSEVTHSRASEMNALWLNLPFSHLLLFRKSKPCSTAALKLHIKCEGCIYRRQQTKLFKARLRLEPGSDVFEWLWILFTPVSVQWNCYALVIIYGIFCLYYSPTNKPTLPPTKHRATKQKSVWITSYQEHTELN